jgi:hypothetical protein
LGIEPWRGPLGSTDGGGGTSGISDEAGEAIVDGSFVGVARTVSLGADATTARLATGGPPSPAQPTTTTAASPIATARDE